MADILQVFEMEFTEIERRLTGRFEAHTPFVNEVCEYIVKSGGKRIRPLLTVLFARLCGREDQQVFELSVVPEYLHSASLLHDDVIDEGEMRRNLPPAYKLWGNKATILAGDFLYAKAIYIAAEFGIAEIASVIAKTVALMSEGEIIQLLNSKTPELTQQMCHRIIDRKTGALIAASCQIGAILAGADITQVELAKNYGMAVGAAFQIADDLLDYSADSEALGKKVGTDLKEGKLTFPVVLAREAASSSDRERLERILFSRQADEQEIVWVRSLLASTGALQKAQEKAMAFAAQAITCLQGFEDNITRIQLENIARFVVERTR